MTTTEFIILPPCGDRITYEILMNSPHPILFVMDPSSPFVSISRELSILSLDYYIQMIVDVKPKITQNSPVDTG